MVAKWGNLPITQVDELDYLYYRQLLRDAFIDRMNSTESGRKYLDEAWLLSKSEPDRKTARELFG